MIIACPSISKWAMQSMKVFCATIKPTNDVRFLDSVTALFESERDVL